ncbi:hypothetical protein HX052_11060 [Myroides marinus]|uniref:SnoaL-like domain-containing protein n=1 Tax=Myroides marinus TaxID=703342 RepID=A0A165RXJ5_9FLAO|nr:hypothetical protein [Myroides marinus]KUF47207.1 hypothetical protein AS361_14375 [Myroides marinus]KZE79748.1 hypothetical protein AV926_11250 [Myroides marinus]MDM1369145.1 hypothetical protein [Myroides marinus]MDM1372056.1 hypothetical protein [Myroides marinus]MDM1376001.1 hypothetical protein [Myroides marinus]
MTNKDLVKNCFLALFEQSNYDSAVIEKYFSAEYIQCVDGVIFDYFKFMTHIKKLKELTRSLTLKFNYIIGEGDIVFTNHTVTVVKNDGSVSKVKVIATFIIKDNKIVYCDELTRHLEGNEDDANFGSVV